MKFQSILVAILFTCNLQMNAGNNHHSRPICGLSNFGKCPNRATHYLTHLGTDLASRVAALACVVAGIEVQEKSNFNAAPIIGGVLGLFIFYKTPEWTDKYILENELDRTSQDKIITFLTRLMLQFPLGTILGETCLTDGYLT